LTWKAGGRAWRLAALLGLLVLLQFGDAPERTQLWNALFDAGHAPLFGVLALVLRGFVSGSQARRSWLALAAVAALGALTELAQVLQPNRDVSLEDLLRDLGGGAAFLLLHAARKPVDEALPLTAVRRRGRLFVLVAVVLLAACVAELGFEVAGSVQRARAMPVLARFDGSWWERPLIDLRGNTLVWPAYPGSSSAWSGPPLARLDLQPALYAGLSIDEPYGDWRGYRTLVLTLVSDLAEPLPVTLRIHDALHDNRYRDRYNTSIQIAPGENRIAISLDEVRRAPDRREMDMGRIRGLVLFVYRLHHPTHLYLMPMGLE
jgi:hypothetical protein